MIIVSHKSFENYGYCLLRRNHHCGRLVVTSSGFASVASCTLMFNINLTPSQSYTVHVKYKLAKLFRSTVLSSVTICALSECYPPILTGWSPLKHQLRQSCPTWWMPQFEFEHNFGTDLLSHNLEVQPVGSQFWSKSLFMSKWIGWLESLLRPHRYSQR